MSTIAQPYPTAKPYPASPPRETIDLRAAIHDAATRATLAVGLGGIAVIHAVDSVGKWSETRYMFWMYMALIVASIALAAITLFHRSRTTFLAAAGLAATVMAGFIVNRTVGLPGAMDDIGNWTEPLGLASLVVEGMVIAVGLGGYLSRSPRA